MTLRHPVLLVFVGGMLGGAARIGIDAVLPAAAGMPWDLVAINIVGSAALGAIDGHLNVRGSRWWRPFVATGVLGGFTTFSSVAALQWTSGAGAGASIALLAVTVVATVVAAVVSRRWAIARAGAAA
ncbi:CrcB family protein [Demequina sp. NBRC 110055]|uniref:fluoride efflux transporter FluC n=1 Tax=Demequina sp. NBRC 110055 TaxID=1570344 RepID=UPI000A067A21|nr:CrcB family protein [Demequina sp. NBRC 110055]